MDNVFISQIASYEGPQQELDQVSKTTNQKGQLEQANTEIFIQVLDNSLKEVNQMLGCEKKDRLKEKDQDDESQQEEQE